MQQQSRATEVTATDVMGDLIHQSSFESSTMAQTSGLVIDYEVLESSIDDVTGLEFVRVSADICQDPRLALRFHSNQLGVSAFAQVASEGIATEGWLVTLVSDSRDGLEVALSTGASHMADVEVFVSRRDPWRSLELADVTVTINVRDIFADRLLFSFAETRNGTGRTIDEAAAAAMPELAKSFAALFLASLSSSEGVASVLLSVDGATMSHTPAELAQFLMSSTQIVDLGATTWNDASQGSYDLLVQTSLSGCELAQHLEGITRLLIRSQNCSSGTAHVSVLRQ